jgi:branched-chain amino acid transport system permease protein
MEISIVIQVILGGVMLGGIYSLVSVGLTIIFGVVKIVNFAHGDFLMIGMFLTFGLWFYLGHLDPLISLFIVVPVVFLFGTLIYRFFFRRVVNENDEAKILLTVGLSLVLQNLTLLILSANYRSVKTSYSDMYIRISEVILGYPRLIAFSAAILISGALWYFLTSTDMGKAMRAAAQDGDVAQLMGINTDRIYKMAVGLAAAVTAACGVVIMPYFYVYPGVGNQFTLMSFAVVIMGGLGSVRGAFFCGMILGISESLGVLFISADSGVMVAFIILVLVLIFRPEGLLAKGRA